MKFRQPHNFTIVELLVVIAIIAVLAAIMFPALSQMKGKAKNTSCSSNLKQFHLATELYRNSWGDYNYESWLSNLYKNEITLTNIYVCPNDPKNGERSAHRPKGSDTYDELKCSFDSPENTKILITRESPNPDVPHVSYIYEFCTGLWPSGWDTDKDAKGNPILITGDDWSFQHLKKELLRVYPGVSTRLPLVRCFWHAKGDRLEPVLNVTAGGNIYWSKSDWQDGVAF